MMSKNQIVKKDLKKSNMTFKEHFQKAVLDIFKGEIEIVEGITDYAMAETLDMLGGIDLWHFNTNMGIRGVANRIQYPITDFLPNSWRTFTIRKDRKSGARTEYEKRKYAIENDYLYPALTLQGYFNEKSQKVLAWAMAKTKDIIWLIDNGFFYVQHTGITQIGQSAFYVVNWDDFDKNNLRIYIAD